MAAGIANAFANALGKHQMMAVAWGKVRSGLGDADNRPVRLQLGLAQPEIEVALDIERGHVDIVGIGEPGARSQCLRHRIFSRQFDFI
jgi:hypothetical protein